MGKGRKQGKPQGARQEPEGCQAEKLVFISWKDHAAEGAWVDVDSFHGPALCYSVGWLRREDDEGITIAANWSPKGNSMPEGTGNLQYILKACITQRRGLTVK